MPAKLHPVKLVLNTAVDPHFCALFSAENKLLQKISWENHRQDGQKVWDFLRTVDTKKITFAGGVSGPGGFSSLRAGAGILNALSFAADIPVHQIRADRWMTAFLGHEDFLLNSFGSSVWHVEKGEIVRTELTELPQKKYVTAFLPEAKREGIVSRDADFSGLEKSLLTALEKTEPQQGFHPDYEFPAV
ncbi:MAG: hypothetical protein K9M51_01060 [Candidatus Gracilibacteria bacterium]|nr:hypothetical protein [Candidatus Gracilibacteria bacterium]